MSLSKAKVAMLQALVDEVQNHPCLWNQLSHDYKDAFMKLNAWELIQKNMQSNFSIQQLIANKMDTVEVIKGQWRNQRDKFTKIKREIKAKTKSGAGLSDIQGVDWSFYKKVKTLIHETFKCLDLNNAQIPK